MAAATGTSARRRVRVWFGSHPITDSTTDKAHADQLASAMQRRFPSLRVTNEPVAPRPEDG